VSDASTEIIFEVQEAPEGGFTAHALGNPIFTDGDSLEELRRNARDAVRCHFEEKDQPRVIRLHFVRDDLIPV